MPVSDDFTTHEVHNQPALLSHYNAWLSDVALKEWVAEQGGGWAAPHLSAFGALAGGELMELGVTANENRPRLRAFDRYGCRLDEVEFHPAYHRIMERAMAFGVHNYSWVHEDKPGAHVVRAALLYLLGQAEAGTVCPLTMTHAAFPVLRRAGELGQSWCSKILAGQYDPRMISVHEKAGCTLGMGMTEKQGGSDVRANTTRAIRASDGGYELVGHKWFFSAPMCDAHLVLAQADGGLSCFLLPRLLPAGSRNAVRIQRLKDKLGDWSNASAEVEFQGARASLIGEEGRGVATILEMVALTRLDCMLGSAALMRQALVQALHHTSQRAAFGRPLIQQPLMRNVLADLSLESEAAVALALRVARAVDGAARGDLAEAALSRVATALGKYWICKRAPGAVNEAQECLGGIGYVEETSLPRLYRQAPLNSIWEGSGNIQCLDVLRALRREPGAREALFAELASVKGRDARLDAEVDWIERRLDDRIDLELSSRLLVERAALALQAAVLLQGDVAIAHAFCGARLGGQSGRTFGTLSADAPIDLLIGRAMLAEE